MGEGAGGRALQAGTLSPVPPGQAARSRLAPGMPGGRGPGPYLREAGRAKGGPGVCLAGIRVEGLPLPEPGTPRRAEVTPGEEGRAAFLGSSVAG